jgi:hypothetical protein
MSKKLIAALMAIAAFAAFGMSATSASAAPVVTHPTGTVLATGTKLTGTSIGHVTFTSSTLNVTCTTGTITGPLVSNSTAGGFSGEITEAHFTGTGTSGDCTATGSFFNGSAKPTPEIVGGLPWCIKNTLNDNFEIRGGKCSEAARSIKFGLDLTGLVTCTYERASLTGTFDTHPLDASGRINANQAWTLVSGFGCPSSPSLDMEFTLETDTTPTSDPIYISS